MRVSTFITSTCLVSLFMTNGAHALFGPSTTDYLVRFQALRYLDPQNEIKMNLEAQLKKVDAKATKEIEAEKQLWETQVNAAKASIELVNREKQLVLDEMKKEYAGKIKGIEEAIDKKRTELASLSEPGIWNSLFGASPDKAESELATMQMQLMSVMREPELAEVTISDSMKLKMQEANDAIKTAEINLKNLGAQTKIRRLKTTAARLKGDITRIEKSMDCMIKLAECKEVNNRASLSKGSVCAVANLSQGRIKATNAKCAALTIDSKWTEVDGCIAEYRTDILKKSGTEGLSAKFKECRSLGL